LFDATFPLAPVSPMLRGTILLVLEEFASAAEAFAQVLATSPGQPDALLHRTRALSLLGDAAAGEASANRLIEVGMWHQGEASYWRAWNRRALGRLDSAAADIDAARPLLFNAAVPKLARFIAFERDQLDSALAELSLSRERNAGDCEVLFALGQVHAHGSAWPEAAAAYSETIACTQAAQRAAAVKQEEIATAALDDARRARMLARARQTQAAEHAREGLATLNAAIVLFLRASRLKPARSPIGRSHGRRSPLVPVSCWAGCMPTGDSSGHGAGRRVAQ
jgi:tetratricopeptide (TPR) repeat protein